MPLVPKLSDKKKRRGDQSSPSNTQEVRRYPYQPIRDAFSSIGSVGGLVPMPFVQPVLSTFTNAFDSSQAIMDNRERCNELQERTKALICLVRQAAIIEHKGEPSHEIKESLTKAESSLLAIAEKLNNWSRWKTLPKELARSIEYRHLLIKYQTELEDARFNFTLEAALALRTELARMAEIINNIPQPRPLEQQLSDMNEAQIQGPSTVIGADENLEAREPSGHDLTSLSQWVWMAYLALTICGVSVTYWLSIGETMLEPQSVVLQMTDKEVEAQITGLSVLTEIPSLNENIPAAPDYFFGRDEIMKVIIGNFTRVLDRDVYKNIALTGDAGVGKSTIGLGMINHAEIDSVFGTSRHWLFFPTEPNVDGMVHSLAKSLPLNTRSNDHLKDIVFYLRFNTAPILIVFDNFTMPESLSERKPLEDTFGKLRQFPHVHMLLTTRDLPLPENVRWLHLVIQPLSREAAIQTYKSISPYHDDQIGDLVEELGCIPFAIVIIAKEGQLGFYPTELLRRLRFERKPDLSPIDNYIRLSLTSKRFTSNPEALTLLMIIAKLPNGIRYDNITEIAPGIHDHYEAVKSLLASSLASRERNGFIQVHAPTRSYISRNYVLEPSHQYALQSYYYKICRDGENELGTEGFRRASSALNAEGQNPRAVLLDALQNNSSAEVIHAVIGYSNYLCHDLPNVDILVKAIEVIENNPSLDEDGRLLSRILVNYGRILNRLNKYHDAERIMKKAERIIRKAGSTNFRDLGQIYIVYGEINRVLLQWSRTHKSYIRARDYFIRAGDSIGISQSLRGQALMSFYDGDIEKSVRLLDYAKEYSRGHELGTTTVLFGLGWVLRHQNATYSVKVLQQARTAYTKFGARYEAALCIYQTGIAQYSLKLYDEATMSLSTAYQEFDALNAYSQMGYVLIHLVELEHLRRNFEQALRLNAEARSVFEKIENPKEAARCVISRARVYSTMCQLDDARGVYQSAKSMVARLDNDPKLLQMIDQEVRGLRRMCRTGWRKLIFW